MIAVHDVIKYVTRPLTLQYNIYGETKKTSKFDVRVCFSSKRQQSRRRNNCAKKNAQLYDGRVAKY